MNAPSFGHLKHIIALCGFLFVFQTASAQPAVLWTRQYGGAGEDRCHHIETTSDGGFIIAGLKNNDFWVIRINSDGDSLWSRTFGYGGPDLALYAAENATGNIFVFGVGCLDNVQCGTWLVRLTAEGETINTQFLDNGVAEAIRRTSDQGFIIVGSTQAQNDDFWMLKADADGNEEWSSTLGAPGDQEVHCVWQIGDDGYILGGQAQHSVARLQRVTAMGQNIWVHNYPAQGASSCRGITVTASGDIVFAGHSDPITGGMANFMLMKVDAQGDSIWRRLYGNGLEDEFAYDMIPTLDHGYLLVGERTNPDTAYAVRTDSTGDVLWSQLYGGNSAFYSTLQTADGGYLLGGQINGDVYLVRLGPELVTPQNLTVYHSGNDIVLRWADDNNPFYRIYSSTSPAGPFETLEGSTASHTLTIPGFSDAPMFFVVVGWDGN